VQVAVITYVRNYVLSPFEMTTISSCSRVTSLWWPFGCEKSFQLKSVAGVSGATINRLSARISF